MDVVSTIERKYVSQEEKIESIIGVNCQLQRAVSRNCPFSTIRSVLIENPSSIRHTDSHGRTPLFLAVLLNANLPIIRLLLAAYPDAASIANHMGELPLHVTCSISTAELLIREYPEGIRRPTKAKWLPLHTARSTPLAKLIIEEGIKRHVNCRNNTSFVSGMYQKDAEGQTPLERLGNSITWCVRCTISGTRKQRLVPLNPIASILWNQFYILTRASAKYYMYTQEDVDLTCRSSCWNEEKFYMVHSLVEVGLCWQELLEVALELYPEQVLEQDGLGRTPLAIAVTGGRRNKDLCQRELPFHEVIQLLLKQSKEAARIPDRRGRLPLHIAAEAGRDLFRKGGIKDIIFAEPRALETRDPKTGMYPFMIAATASDRSGCDCGKEGCCCAIDAIYFLLRESPSVLKIIIS